MTDFAAASEILMEEETGQMPIQEENRIMRIVIIGILFLILTINVVNAQDGIDHGANGTLNLDYFNPTNDAHMKWLINDIETHHLKPAIRSFGEGDLQKARVDLDYLLARLVNHPQALAFGGVLAKSLKNPLLASNYFERSLKLYPQYALTHAQYGKYLTDIDRMDAGIEKLKQALAMDPKLIAAHVWIAAAYLKNGNTELARQAAEQARSLGYKGDLRAYGVS